MPSKQQPITIMYKRISTFLFSVVPVLGISVYMYGARPIIMVIIATLAAILSDVLVSIMRKRKYDGRDFSSIMYAVFLVLLLPASLRYGIVITAIVFTLFVKHAFGGYSGSIFHPTAFGFVASAICWPDEIFMYPWPFSHIAMGANRNPVLYMSATLTIKNGGIPNNIDRVDYLLGNHPGPLGASFGIIILAILLFLIACKATSWHAPLAYILTVVIYSLLFSHLKTSIIDNIIYELFSDGLIFGAVYIASDPVTSPTNSTAKIIYGFLVGLLAMIFGHYGVYQIGVMFAVLLINPLSSYLDRKFPSKGVLR